MEDNLEKITSFDDLPPCVISCFISPEGVVYPAPQYKHNDFACRILQSILEHGRYVPLFDHAAVLEDMGWVHISPPVICNEWHIICGTEVSAAQRDILMHWGFTPDVDF